jgi:alkaline phosphatase D
VIATEFVGTSVTSSSGGWAERFLLQNPHVKFHEWRNRGYAYGEIPPDRWRTDFRAIRNVADPKAETVTLKWFVVESGQPRA